MLRPPYVGPPILGLPPPGVAPYSETPNHCQREFTMKTFTSIAIVSALAISQSANAWEQSLQSNTQLNAGIKDTSLTATFTQTGSQTLSGSLITIDPGIIQDPNDWYSWVTQPQHVEARINNNAQAVTEEIVPLIADSAGLNAINIANQTIASGTLPSSVTWALACHNTSAVWHLNMNNIEVDFPIDANTIAASIRDNQRINTDINENGFELEFQMQFSYPKNVGGLYCSWGGHDINIRVNVNVDGIDGEFDIILENDGSSRVQIADIRKFELAVDNVSFDSSFLTSLTNLGISVANLFGAGCANLTDCVNMAVSDMLSNNNDIENMLEDAINQALDISLSLEGGTNIGSANLDYAVSLETLETSNALDRLNTKWLVAFDGDNPSTDCTDNLTQKAFFPNNNLSTNDDFDVVFPFKVITNLLYTVTRQLEPCVNFIWAGMPGGDGELEVKPNGYFGIEAVSSNELTVSLPIVAEATNFAYGDGTINATAELTAEINPACGAGFEIEVTDIQIANITGAITWNLWGFEYEMDAADFLSDAVSDVEADLMSYFSDPIVLLPESFGLNNVSQFVSIGDIVSNSSAIAIGLNITDTDPNCS